MKNVDYVILVIGIIGIIMIIVGVLIQNNCDNKTPKEYFESEICQNVGNSKR